MSKTWRDRRKSRARNGTASTAAASTTIRPLLPEVEVAAILNIPKQTLRNARTTGTGDFASLRWFKLGPRVRYRPEDVEGWVAERERVHEGPEAA